MPKFDITDEGGVQYARYTCPGCKCEHAVPTKRWNWNGSVDKPTLNPSVRHYYTIPAHDDKAEREVTTCHYKVKDGMIEYCDDCSHKLKGKTVELPNCFGTEST